MTLVVFTRPAYVNNTRLPDDSSRCQMSIATMETSYQATTSDRMLITPRRIPRCVFFLVLADCRDNRIVFVSLEMIS